MRMPRAAVNALPTYPRRGVRDQSPIRGICPRPRRESPSRRRAARLAWQPELEDVGRREGDDPEHVDEVPVDPGHLDAEMILGLRAVVAAEGADGRDPQQDQPDRDVGAVEPREAVEDRSEGVV